MFNYLISALFTYIIKLAAKIVFFCIQSIPYEIFFQQFKCALLIRRDCVLLRVGDSAFIGNRQQATGNSIRKPLSIAFCLLPITN